MTTITQYKCDICGQLFDSEELCSHHESAHAAPVTLSHVLYDSGRKYPHYVTIETQDGDLVQYTFYQVVKGDPQ